MTPRCLYCGHIIPTDRTEAGASALYCQRRCRRGAKERRQLEVQVVVLRTALEAAREEIIGASGDPNVVIMADTALDATP